MRTGVGMIISLTRVFFRAAAIQAVMQLHATGTSFSADMRL